MPNIDLGALGFGFGSQNDFLRAARILEDIGVTAYSGAAGLLKTPDIITTAACLLGAEAEHAATIRTQIARLKIPTTALDGVDLVPPPSGEARQSSRSKSAMGWSQRGRLDRCSILRLGESRREARRLLPDRSQRRNRLEQRSEAAGRRMIAA